VPEISVLVEGGKASAGAPLGPALGPLGVNIGEIVNAINDKTKDYSGMKVPVKVVVDVGTKEFEIKVGSPPASALIKKELGIDTAAQNPKTEVVGNLSMEQVIKIVKMKMDDLASYRLKSSAREIIGTCNSMGVTVNGKKAKLVQEEIEKGMHDLVLSEQGESKPVPAPKAEAKPSAESQPAKAVEGAQGETEEKAEALMEEDIQPSEGSDQDQKADALMEEKKETPVSDSAVALVKDVLDVPGKTEKKPLSAEADDGEIQEIEEIKEIKEDEQEKPRKQAEKPRKQAEKPKPE